ncbi:hypothetical protein BB029_27595 [Pseudomonas sp. S3E12]|nr:hypothetical protein BB029_27595 [Pseudomonas sp. S3E12]
MDFKRFKQSKFTTKFTPSVSDDGQRLCSNSYSIGATAQNEIHASDIGQGEISAVGDMSIEVEVQWPDAHSDDG